MLNLVCVCVRTYVKLLIYIYPEIVECLFGDDKIIVPSETLIHVIGCDCNKMHRENTEQFSVTYM